MDRNGYSNDAKIQLLNQLAISEWKGGLLDSAYVHINQAINIDPSQAIPYTTVAEVYYAQGNKKMLYNTMQKAVDLGLHFNKNWFEDEPYDVLENDVRFMKIIQPAIQRSKERLEN